MFFGFFFKIKTMTVMAKTLELVWIRKRLGGKKEKRPKINTK